MSKLKFTYFNGRGRAETCRYLFAAGKIAYEDNRIEQADWPKLKPETPYGALPLLEVGKDKLGQSMAVARYIAKQAKLYGSSPLDQAQIDAIADAVNDFRESVFTTIAFEADADAKKKKQGEFVEKNKAALDNLTKLLAKNNYFVGNKLSMADIHFYACSEVVITTGQIELFKGHPTLKALYDRVAKNKEIEAYSKKRPETPF